MRFLIVEPDQNVAKTLELYLTHQDHEVDCVATAELALAFGDGEVDRYDAMVIERTLADGSGLEVLRSLRHAHVDVPIMIVDSGTGLQALQRADDIGADDYLGKPFEFRELLARIQAHVRRRHDVFDPVIALGELMVDCGRRRLVWRGRPIDLTPKQFAMVEHLAMAVGRVVTREQMMARLYGWREDAPEAKTLDVHMSHLRKKIREATGGSDIIRTVWGVGYVIERPDAMAAAQPEIGQRPAAALRHEVIARGIAERHGLTLADVRGRDNGHGRLRARYLARAEIALALLTELEWSTAQIGRYFKRNHTTIMAMLRCTAPMVYPHCLEAREAAKRAEAVALRRQGNATKHIAKRMGRSEVWARMVFRAAGLTGRCPAPRSEAAP